MPLLTTTQLTNARIAELGQNIASHLAAAARAANEQTATAMALSDADLSDWLNAQGAELDALFAAHAELGQAINTASEVAVSTLSASGINAPAGIVDIRPVSEKLAAQNRQIQVVDGIFSVTTLPPETPQDLTGDQI